MWPLPWMARADLITHMEPPKSIQIAGHRIKIQRVKDLVITSEAFGAFSATTMTIYLDASLSGTHLEEVFWHEVVEAIDTLCELKLEHPVITSLGLHLQQVAAQL